MSAYTGQQASDYSRQHNGNVYQNYYGDQQRKGEKRTDQHVLDQKLHDAAESGQPSRVRHLLTQGANIDAPAEHVKWSILHSALGEKVYTSEASKSSAEVVESLVAAGADVHDRSAGNRMTPLHFAGLGGHADAIKVLLRHGARVNAEDDDSQTPLHYAVIGRHPEAVAALLHAGADVNASNNKNQTPMDSVPEPWGDNDQETPEIKRLLRQYGAES